MGYEEANAPGYAPPEHVGLIGHAFLRRYRVVFDYPSSRLTLIDPKAGRWPRECRRPQTMTIPCQYRDGVTLTALLDGSLSVRLILDTGASVSALKHSVIPETCLLPAPSRAAKPGLQDRTLAVCASGVLTCLAFLPTGFWESTCFKLASFASILMRFD